MDYQVIIEFLAGRLDVLVEQTHGSDDQDPVELICTPLIFQTKQSVEILIHVYKKLP